MELKQYRGTAHISYDVIVCAESAEDAEIEIMERLADDVTKGLIRMDLFDNSEAGPEYRFPVLLPVTVEEMSNEA